MTVFRELQSAIVKGVYPVGSQLPSEATLVDRFKVSRQTVRQALRNLRESGLVRSHQGLGTIVEGPGVSKGYVHQINTIGDLFPADVETKYMLPDRKMIPIPSWTTGFPEEVANQTWLHVRATRKRPHETVPFNEMDAFVSAPYAGVGRVIEAHTGSIYGLIEAIYGEVIGEVEQTICTFTCDSEFGRGIGMEEDEIGIEVRRIYRITSNDDIALLSVNRYPATEFIFSMKLRRLNN